MRCALARLGGEPEPHDAEGEAATGEAAGGAAGEAAALAAEEATSLDGFGEVRLLHGDGEAPGETASELAALPAGEPASLDGVGEAVPLDVVGVAGPLDVVGEAAPLDGVGEAVAPCVVEPEGVESEARVESDSAQGRRVETFTAQQKEKYDSSSAVETHTAQQKKSTTLHPPDSARVRDSTFLSRG